MDLLYLLALSFWLAFVFTSPGAVYNFSFIDSFQKVVGLASQGIGIDEAGPGKWLNHLVTVQFAGGWFIPIASVLSVPIVIFYKKGLLKSVYPIWVWVGMFLGLVLLFIKLNYSYYLLPLLPFVVILASFSLESLSAEISRKWNFFMIFIFMVASSVFIALVGIKFDQVQEFKEKLEKPGIGVGEWLVDKNVNGFIMSDYYVYVPPQIDSVKFTWGLTPAQIELKPDWIIVNAEIRQRWINRTDDKGKAVNRAYNSLINSTDYRLEKEFESIRVYQKQTR
jgi:hypothetical protein